MEASSFPSSEAVTNPLTTAGTVNFRSKRQASNITKPFLKWAGRKTKLISTINRLLPENARRFIEPFVGSGAVFINTGYSASILSDTNRDIISLFEILRKEKTFFIQRCSELFSPENNTAERFNLLRETFNATHDAEKRAMLFIYLNRHCFNGLCRYNKKGDFNTPFGTYDKPYFPRDEMLVFAEKLATASLVSQDFRLSLAQAGSGDVVYCDPPYVPLSETASFTDYVSGGFSSHDQEDLARRGYQAAKRGAVVLISNHDTPLTRSLYRPRLRHRVRDGFTHHKLRWQKPYKRKRVNRGF